MKQLSILIFLLILYNNIIAQDKWYKVTKNDIATMSLELGAGYTTGWREEVLYHPNALFRHFPNLNRNFWDNRISSKRNDIKDANHMLKASYTLMHLTAIAIKVGDFKQYKRWKKVRKIAFDVFKNYCAYQAGFYLSYNLTHKNKL